MRTLEEIKADVNIAIDKNDFATLQCLANELDELASPQAAALAYSARGWACNCTGEYATALEHYNRCLALYHELGNRNAVPSITGNIGNVYVNTGDYPAALEHFNTALALCSELGIRNGVAHFNCSIGNVYVNTGDCPAALEYYNNALVLHNELGNRIGLAIVTGNIGSVYLYTGDYPAALEHFNRALAQHQELGNHSSVARVTGSIGNVYVDTGNYPAALEHYSRALTLFHELGDVRGAALATGSIGNVYSSIGDYPAALEHYNVALAQHHELGNRTGVATVTGNVLHTLLSQNDVDGARRTLTALDELHIDSPDVIISQEGCRAKLHVLEGDLQAAQMTLANALDLATAHGLRAKQADVCKELRELAQKRNDFAGYIEHNNEYTRINEEIRGADAKLKMAMQAKEREIAEREMETAKHMAVLHSTLPKHVADRVARGEVVNDSFENAAVLFLDIVGFTTMSSQMEASAVVELLDRVFAICDSVMNKHGMMKIKTIGDSYMAVSFDNIENAALAALDLVTSITEVQIRIGIHCGPVVAGVLGKERMQYDVWGDTVNTASRMESSSLPGRIHISEAFAIELGINTEYRIQNSMIESKNTESLDSSPVTSHLTSHSSLVTSHLTSHSSLVTSHFTHSSLVTSHFSLQLRGEIDIKGKGPMTTYWLERM